MLRPAVIGGAAGHRMVEVVAAFEHRGALTPAPLPERGAFGKPLAEHIQQPMAKDSALKTPPLKSTCVGRTGSPAAGRGPEGTRPGGG